MIEHCRALQGTIEQRMQGICSHQVEKGRRITGQLQQQFSQGPAQREITGQRPEIEKNAGI